MRVLRLVLFPILMLAQSSAPPGKGVPVGNAVTITKGVKDSTTKQNSSVRPSPPIPAPTENGPDTRQSSPPQKTPDVTPDPIVKYTKWLVIVGILQFVALIIQAVFLCLAFNETTKATGLTAKALAEAVRSNAANEALTTQSNKTTQNAVFEARRSNAENERLTSESLTETRNATALTKDSIILTHRPKVIVRAFFVHGGMSAFKDQSSVVGVFEVSNIGGTRATVTEVYATAMMHGFLPMERPYENGSPSSQMPEPRHLNPGESMRGTFRKDDGVLQQGEVSEIVGSSRNSRSLYVLGFVKYHDNLEPPTPRRTVFCRRFDRSAVRFTPVEDDDYENAD